MQKTLHIMRQGFLVLAASAATGAFAQWAWIDHAGHKVYSDRPPPSSVPAKNILRRPGAGSHGLHTVVSRTAASAVPHAAASKPAGGNTEEEARKKAAAEKEAKVKADNCQRAQSYRNTLQSGYRVSTMNAKGERIIMDDAAKAAELKRAEEAIAANCK
ncbi:MAG: DUF4124 domain-containing protein [Brachymonas sp.]